MVGGTISIGSGASSTGHGIQKVDGLNETTDTSNLNHHDDNTTNKGDGGVTETAESSSSSSSSSNETPPPPPEEKPYSIYTSRHRKILTLVLGFISLASPLTAQIYLPLLPMLRERYSVTVQQINLTVTIFVVVQAVMPAFLAPIADAHGRRLVALCAFVVYCLACLGMALNDASAHRAYAALLVLRALQAVGISTCANTLYAVISYVAAPAQRSGMVGVTISAGNLGIVLGPVVGGVVAWTSGGSLWVFFGLLIFGCLALVGLACGLPETARNVVGDGSEGKRLTMRGGPWSWIVLGPRWGASKNIRPVSTSHGADNREEGCKISPEAGQKCQQSGKGPRSLRRRALRALKNIPNPLSCLAILLDLETALIMWLPACTYGVNYTAATALPTYISETYHWNELYIGLAYLPAAATIIAAGFVNRPWARWCYRKVATAAGLPETNHHVDGFPIERARIAYNWPFVIAYYSLAIGLGWAIHFKAHPAVVLVLDACMRASGAIQFFGYNTLAIDIHPDKASTAAAAASLVRSGLSGIGTAVFDPMVRVMGWGWFFTTVAAFIGTTQVVAILVVLKWGMGWREARRARERVQKAQEEEERNRQVGGGEGRERNDQGEGPCTPKLDSPEKSNVEDKAGIDEPSHEPSSGKQ